VKKMYKTLTRLSLLLLSLVIFSFTMADKVYSKIDPETVVGVWLLDDAQGKVAVDSSKNAYDGKITGGQWVAGKFGKALEFDGKTDNVEVVDAKELDAIPQITVVCWVNYAKEPPQNYAPVGKEPLYRFIIGKGGSGHFVVATAANGWYSAGTVASGAGITQGEWHHLAGIYDGNKVRFYVDGKLAGEGPQNIAGDILDNAAGFTIAKTTANNVDFFAGVIDDIAVFKIAISEEDIKNIIAVGLANAIAGKAMVSDHGKLSATWASIKLSIYK
jgi:hypothetical protein